MFSQFNDLFHPYLEEWNKILAFYDDCVTEADVMQRSKKSGSNSIFDIYLNIIIERIIKHFCDQLNIEEKDAYFYFYLNSCDSQFYINGILIDSYNTYQNVLTMFQKIINES
ncbi:hypothetical protein ACFFHT_08875 [Gallibacterium melopsittaci]|uniref:CdiI immunity protein domain-containing protein n=1 Tax=Gallibacterium melopsittaci TaxID=516063 RepID=A0ABV6HXN4_9PAST